MQRMGYGRFELMKRRRPGKYGLGNLGGQAAWQAERRPSAGFACLRIEDKRLRFSTALTGPR